MTGVQTCALPICFPVTIDAVGEYAPCMCVNSEAAAVRIFTNEVNRYDPNNLLSTNKTDFTLYVVGEFDLSSGCVVNRDPRVLIHVQGQGCSF